MLKDDFRLDDKGGIWQLNLREYQEPTKVSMGYDVTSSAYKSSAGHPIHTSAELFEYRLWQ